MGLKYHIKNSFTLYKLSNQLRTLTSNSTSVICNNKIFKNQTNECNSIKNTCEEQDLSGVTSFYPKSFNFAAYVNSSETLQKLIELNVDLSKIEKKPKIAEKLLHLDMNSNINNHIVFLSDYVEMKDMGKFITKNVMIFYESIDDLKVRVNYLMSKKFNDHQIRFIISKNPFWLMFR